MGLKMSESHTQATYTLLTSFRKGSRPCDAVSFSDIGAASLC
jgi:hypothetical protein